MKLEHCLSFLEITVLWKLLASTAALMFCRKVSFAQLFDFSSSVKWADWRFECVSTGKLMHQKLFTERSELLVSGQW